MIKTSVVIICYNEEKNLRKLISQSLRLIKENKNLEIIIVENGSTDQSKKIILKENSIHRNKLKFVYVKKNKGYGFGIISGLIKTNGEVIGWTHGDDLKLYSKITKVLKLITYKKRFFLKGYRIGKRPLLDLFFSYSFNFTSSIFLKKFLWEIMAHPTFFSLDLFSKFKKPPNDFSLDLYVYFFAKLYKFKINRFKYKYTPRKHGVSSWNVNFFSKIKLASKFISYLNRLKNLK